MIRASKNSSARPRRTTQSGRIRTAEDDCNNRRRRRYHAAKPRSFANALRSRCGDRSTPQKSKKYLAMPSGIVTNGVILRALGRHMRKLKTRHPRSLPSRLILIVAGALMLIAAFAPRANAQLIAYFNFEGPPTPPFPVNLGSQVPPGAVNTTIVTNYNPNNMSAEPGLPLNVAPGDPDPNLVAMGLRQPLIMTRPILIFLSSRRKASFRTCR